MPPFCCLLSRYKGNKGLCLMNQIHICHFELFTSASFKQTQEASCLPPLLGLHTFLLKINFKKGLCCFIQRVYCHCVWQVLIFCHGDQSIQKVRSEVSNKPGEGVNSPVECGSGTGPGTCCPLWQCHCAFQMLCGKVVLGKQGDDKPILSSIA